jgi:hypothetical protein
MPNSKVRNTFALPLYKCKCPAQFTFAQFKISTHLDCTVQEAVVLAGSIQQAFRLANADLDGTGDDVPVAADRLVARIRSHHVCSGHRPSGDYTASVDISSNLEMDKIRHQRLIDFDSVNWT